MQLLSSEHKPTAQNDKKTARRYRLAVLNPLEQKGVETQTAPTRKAPPRCDQRLWRWPAQTPERQPRCCAEWASKKPS